MTECSVQDCGVPSRARGWCRMHYHRWQRVGDVHAEQRPQLRRVDPAIRWWSYVERTATGWWWTGYVGPNGYGALGISGKHILAHRFAYELLIGPIPKGLQLDHLCRDTSCVKVIADEYGPAHIEAVTPRVNSLRSFSPLALNAQKTHCKHGHPFDAANTYARLTGGRTCRTCSRLNMLRYRAG